MYVGDDDEPPADEAVARVTSCVMFTMRPSTTAVSNSSTVHPALVAKDLVLPWAEEREAKKGMK